MHELVLAYIEGAERRDPTPEERAEMANAHTDPSQYFWSPAPQRAQRGVPVGHWFEYFDDCLTREERMKDSRYLRAVRYRTYRTLAEEGRPWWELGIDHPYIADQRCKV